MKKKRVGTLTMALVLIFTGVLMLLARTMDISALDYFVKFWPLTLFLLGGEILFSYFKYRKDDQVRIGYDFLSIVIVLIIVGVNLGLYSFMETGLLEGLKNIANMEDRIYKLDRKSFNISEDIEKIVLEDIEDTDLSIRFGDEGSLDVGGELEVTSKSIGDFDEFVERDFIQVEESGKVLYLKFNRKKNESFIEDLYRARMEISIPSSKMIEVSQVANVDISLTQLAEDMVINDAGRIRINVDQPIDYNVLAQISDRERFLGSPDWKIEEARNEEGELIYFIGRLEAGESDHTIKILNSRSVEVNSL